MKASFLDRSTFPTHLDMTPPKGIEDWSEFETTNSGDRIKHCQNAQIILTNKVPIDKPLIDALPDLKLVAVMATGTDHIDVSACSDKGIAVVNAVNYGADAVADHTLMLMLALTRQFKSHLFNAEEQAWARSAHFTHHLAPMHTLSDKTLVLVGTGDIGNAVAARAVAFGMNVLKAERPNQPTRPGYIPFETALQQADILSLHCPLTSETHQIMNQTYLDRLKPGAFVINTARGGLIDESALLTALQSGRVAGAALDVCSQEPPPRDHIVWRLNQHPNVIVTPHIAWATDEAMVRLKNQIWQKISRFIATNSDHF